MSENLWRGVHLAPSGHWPGKLLYLLQSTGQLPGRVMLPQVPTEAFLCICRVLVPESLKAPSGVKAQVPSIK